MERSSREASKRAASAQDLFGVGKPLAVFHVKVAQKIDIVSSGEEVIAQVHAIEFRNITLDNQVAIKV